MQARFAAVTAYLQTRPGVTGIVVRDRQTGAVWRNADAGSSVWTASTTKLAMAVSLLERSRSGEITLTAQDRTELDAMLYSSDDDAADDLWFRYAGPGQQRFNTDAARYGMTGLTPITKYSDGAPYWGFQKCTPDDLDHLIQYALSSLDPADTAFLVSRMTHVESDQQWGVWGAGAAAQPGNKDGWSDEDSGWVLNSVGFVGPGQRYTLAVMTDMAGRYDDAAYDEGTATDSMVAQILFAGRF